MEVKVWITKIRDTDADRLIMLEGAKVQGQSDQMRYSWNRIFLINPGKSKEKQKVSDIFYNFVACARSPLKSNISNSEKKRKTSPFFTPPLSR